LSRVRRLKYLNDSSTELPHKKQKITHAISFHRSILAAERFREQQDALNTVGGVAAPCSLNLHISSRKSAGERAQLMREFTSHSRALLTNARCLTEGVDIPAIDCVLFADPKQSVIDIVQAAGRALRPGKQLGYISGLGRADTQRARDLDHQRARLRFRWVGRDAVTTLLVAGQIADARPLISLPSRRLRAAVDVLPM
jgi:predicted helicase